jgi:hypothetical protein
LLSTPFAKCALAVRTCTPCFLLRNVRQKDRVKTKI